jgi:small subunit ribosomal protein S1
MANEGFDFAQELDLQDLLDKHDYELPEVGDIRKGIIVSKSPQGIIVDLGLKRDGLVPAADLAKLDPAERDTLQVNDEVPVYVVDTEQPDSLTVSIYQAKLNQDWVRAEELLASGEVFESEVIGYNQGGVIVGFGNLRGFVPASHLSDMRRGMNERQRQQRMAKMRGEKIPVKILEVDRRRRRLVLSQRDAQKEWQETRKKELIENLKEGDTLTGRVSGLRPFGAFVDIGGADGLIHISELAWHRVDHPSEVLKVGDEVQVYVLGLDEAEQRIALSRKKLLPDPWTMASQKYKVNQLVEGIITRVVNYGAFVEIEPGVEGLLHSSQLADYMVNDPNEIIKEGETHLLRVIKIDTDRQRIGLSLKAVTPNEQIEWMTRREAEAEEAAARKAQRQARRAREEAPAEEPAPAAEEPTPVAEATPFGEAVGVEAEVEAAPGSEEKPMPEVVEIAGEEPPGALAALPEVAEVEAEAPATEAEQAEAEPAPEEVELVSSEDGGPDES